jgi:transcriptional regulator NrdR family protein
MVKCPKCNNQTRVIGTWSKQDGRRRTHQCKECNMRFCTHQPHPEIVPYDPHFTGKLSESDKREIQAGHKEGVTYFDLSLMYDVSESTIRDIVKGYRRMDAPRLRLIATHSH